MKKLVTLVLLILFSGCSNEKATVFPAEPPIQTSNTAEIQTIGAGQINPNLNTSGINKPLRPNASLISLKLNNQKFTAKSEAVTTGDIVFNVSMRQFGRVKGTIVIIAALKPTWLSEDFDIKRIADNTYRMSIRQRKSDLSLWYRILVTDSRIVTVEVEIDYSPLNETATY